MVEARDTRAPENSSCCRSRPASALPVCPSHPTAICFSISKAIPSSASTASNILFGYLFKDENGKLVYEGDWAFTRADEKRAFESFRRFCHGALGAVSRPAHLPLCAVRAGGAEAPDGPLRDARRRDRPDAARAALRRSLSGRAPRCARQRRELFDQAAGAVLRFRTRDTAWPMRMSALANLQANLELDDAPSIADETKASGARLQRGRLPFRRGAARLARSASRRSLSLAARCAAPAARRRRAERKDHRLADQDQRADRKTDGRRAGRPAERNEEQQARWILANILDWHRREEKAVWWEYFRLADLSAEDLLDERAGLSGLVFVGDAGGTAKAPIHRYRFPPQETEIRGGEELLQSRRRPSSAKSRPSPSMTTPSTSRSARTPPASIRRQCSPIAMSAAR